MRKLLIVAAGLVARYDRDQGELKRPEAYRRFRGRDPQVRALLVKRGFPVQ